MAEKHSIYSPSSSIRWMNCPGSIRMCEGVVDEGSFAADKGTDAHELAALCLTLGMEARDFIGKVLPRTGIEVDDEMAMLVQSYLNYVNSLPGQHFVEQFVDLEVFTDEPDGGGTPDHVAVSDELLCVTDLKYGRSPVKTVGNTQTRMYAAGVLAALMTSNGDVKVPSTVQLAIVQPHLSLAPEIEVLSSMELIAWAETVLVPAVEATREDHAPLNASVDGCEWCPVRGRCAVFAEFAAQSTGVATLEEFNTVFVPPAPELLTDEQLGMILAKAKLVTRWLEAIDTEMLARLNKAPVPGWKLVRGKAGRRKWAEDQEDAIAAVLREDYELANETIFKMELLSPTKMLELPAIKEQHKEGANLLAAFIEQPEGSLCAALESDKRKAVVPQAQIAAEFPDLTTQPA